MTGGDLHAAILDRTARVAVVGLGYVGLPLACAFAERGFHVLGIDIDRTKIDHLRQGTSYIRAVPSEVVRRLATAGTFAVDDGFDRLVDQDIVVICVPTPLTPQRSPDLHHVTATCEAIGQRLRPGQMVVLESTTYPGTTRDVVTPILERSGLEAHRDFLVAYAPEREDPGNPRYGAGNTPRVVGADDPRSLRCAAALYEALCGAVHPVSSAAVAEATKLTENIFRSVNIALVNELKIILSGMDIDIWEVIGAAGTKPFGFMPFHPGPGSGGHCIPIDPSYFSWKARAHGHRARLVDLAGEINRAMPIHVVDVLVRGLGRILGKPIGAARILLVGLAYKKNTDDTRESPAVELMARLEALGATVEYFDPLVPCIPCNGAHPSLAGRSSVPWAPETFGRFDAALIATDHDGVDHATLPDRVPLVVDTRNAVPARRAGGTVLRA
ncbi:MAG: nucleotide sugar dehydrogenase [Alphaproteobacteria bacterium]